MPAVNTPAGARLRPFEPPADQRFLASLWAETVNAAWPVLPTSIEDLREGLVAEVASAIVGVAARSGQALQFLVVSPAWRRRGIGSELLLHMREQARQEGHRILGLGSGGEKYVWPGVPTDCADAGAFFEHHSYSWSYEAIDLTTSMRSWLPPKAAAAAAEGTRVAISNPGEAMSEVLEFEAAHFPNWVRPFAQPAGEIVSARDVETGRLVGTLLWSATGSPYSPLLETPCGWIGCVGTEPTARGKGVATAMVLAATRNVRAAGAASCHIGWAWQTGLYERCGYSPWRRYLMDRRP